MAVSNENDIQILKYEGTGLKLPDAGKIKMIESRILNLKKGSLPKEKLLERIDYVDGKGRVLSAKKYKEAIVTIVGTDAGYALLSGYFNTGSGKDRLTIRVVPNRSSGVGAQGGMRINSVEFNGGMTGSDYRYFKGVGKNVYIIQTLTRTIAHELFHATSSFAHSNEIYAVIAENLIMRQLGINAGNRDGYNRTIDRFQLSIILDHKVKK